MARINIGKLLAWKNRRQQLRASLLKQAKKEKSIIFGARSINKQIAGPLRRPTEDFDILAKKPLKSARKTEKNFDRIVGSDQYYVKSAIHKGTWKVMHKGRDLKKGTKDDVGVVDYSGIPSPQPPTKKIGGIKYRSITQEAKAKKKSLADPAFKFRHKKDRGDLNRIKISKRLKINK